MDEILAGARLLVPIQIFAFRTGASALRHFHSGNMVRGILGAWRIALSPSNDHSHLVHYFGGEAVQLTAGAIGAGGVRQQHGDMGG